MRNAHKILVRKSEEKRHFGGQGVDGSIILKFILMASEDVDLIRERVARTCERGKASSSSVK